MPHIDSGLDKLNDVYPNDKVLTDLELPIHGPGVSLMFLGLLVAAADVYPKKLSWAIGGSVVGMVLHAYRGSCTCTGAPSIQSCL